MNMSPIERVARLALPGGARWATPLEGGGFELLSGDPLTSLARTGEEHHGVVRFLAPVNPTKIIGIGANFPGDEASPGDAPSFFVKAASAIVPHLEDVILPYVFQSVAVEGELAVVIRERLVRAKGTELRGKILGYTIINDLSGRDSTLAYVPPAVKKSCDGLAPLGPFLLLDDAPRTFALRTRQNGAVVQEGHTRDLRYALETCLEYVSSLVTLEPGDIVALGTPTPKPIARPGDHLAVEIDGIGCLENTIREPRPL